MYRVECGAWHEKKDTGQEHKVFHEFVKGKNILMLTTFSASYIKCDLYIVIAIY